MNEKIWQRGLVQSSSDPDGGDPGVSGAPNGEVSGTDYAALYQQAASELETLRGTEEQRHKAERGDLESALERATRAEERAEAVELLALKRQVAESAGLGADAVEFLTGSDSASLSAQASKLASITQTTPGPESAGTTTNPASRQEPSLEERIQDAQQNGRVHEAIALKRLMVFG